MLRSLVTLAFIFSTACSPALQNVKATNVKADNAAFSFSFDEPVADPAPAVSCEKHPCVPTYRLNGEIDEKSTTRAIGWIDNANAAGADAMVLEINTPGGSVPDGFELAKVIENSTAPVTMVVDGEAASMGAYLLQSASKRYMTSRSSLMFHEPSLGGLFRGTPNEWQSIADMLSAMREAIAQHCWHRLNITIGEYRDHTDGNKMWWLTAAKALDVAAIDAIVPDVKAAIKLSTP